jgi:hypothetical protein
MHCLFVKAPFARWIADGVKTIELRSRKTLIRGRIGIIESGSGTVIGDVELASCTYNQSLDLYNWQLAHPRRYAEPVPFEHKQGCVTWIILNIDPERQKIARRISGKVVQREQGRYLAKLNRWVEERMQRLSGRAE